DPAVAPRNDSRDHDGRILELPGFVSNDVPGACPGIIVSTLHKTLVVLGLILIVVGLPVVGRLARQKEGHRCALDGVAIEPIYRVRILDDHNQSHEFCCVKCAQMWRTAHGGHPSAVLVTDETS